MYTGEILPEKQEENETVKLKSMLKSERMFWDEYILFEEDVLCYNLSSSSNLYSVWLNYYVGKQV